MGLLDSLVGALSAGQSAPGIGGSSGGGNAALLNIVLSMLASKGGGAMPGAAADADVGGMGGLGGLGGLMEKFQRGGLGDVMGSWVSSGQNLPVSGEQLGGVLGPDLMAQIAQQLGVSQHDAADQLSQVLPEAVDRLTPEGRVPDGGVGSMADILGRFR